MPASRAIPRTRPTRPVPLQSDWRFTGVLRLERHQPGQRQRQPSGRGARRKLCSGNNPTFRGLDVNRSDWQTTPIQADANGKFTFVFKATAPRHARLALLRHPRRLAAGKPAALGRPAGVLHAGQYAAVGRRHLLQCTLPQRTGQHVIYNTWQRSDSTEAFYTCMDVRFQEAEGPHRHRNGRTPARSPHAVSCRLARRWRCACSTPTAMTSNVWRPPGQRPDRTRAVAVGARPQGQCQCPARARGRAANGVITPTASATDNRVYLKDGNRFQLDTQVPDPGTPSPGGDFDHVPGGHRQLCAGPDRGEGQRRQVVRLPPVPGRCMVQRQRRGVPAGWVRPGAMRGLHTRPDTGNGGRAPFPA